ncbi:MAG: PAS domain-containing protein [Solirubrobacteraceae bacterium]|nr:PAS domain-containing protein [Solirubrobacteraceae bacterium]
MARGTILIVGSGDGAGQAAAALDGISHRVLREADGAAALAALAREPVALVVAEWDLPDGDGMALCRAVREHPSLAAPQFILVGPPPDGVAPVAEALAAGAECLTVPFEGAELLARVRAGLRAMALRADQTRLQALVANVPGAIYRCAHDADYTMEVISDAIESITGYPPSDFVQNACRTFASIIHPEDRAEVERAVDAAVAEGRPFALEYRVVRADGAPRWVLERGRLVRGEDGRSWLDGVIFDITDRRRAEEVLRGQEAERARMAELRASRARIVNAADAARRRIQRDLHDGAQQRLVTLALRLRGAHGAIDADPAAAGRQLEAALDELSQAIADLRSLARGIHPAVLSDRGLGAALASLAARAPLPVELEVHDGRLPAAVESAAYFVVCEALTNVAKYAEATYASVRVVRAAAHLLLEVADDGIGGARGGVDSGLGGLADRVAALDGRLEIISPPGEGTLVRAEIPLDPPPPRAEPESGPTPEAEAAPQLRPA